MPITIKQFHLIKERKVREDRDLLGFMEMNQVYTTNDIQKFLLINHTATLQRLKKLKKLGYLKLENRKIYYWIKIKDMEIENDIKGWTFY